ncbi:S9 family peptidase [Pleionea sp. CnH1-48]|uniref:alpha/beta hydrolase family protein n=1 Tax=Pleionea sp. CnH1-48 TaxID=2954494 RepID=UPI002098221C|nr:alpha/beta fold hydrolase [Pleionea sp. CnH1-48]MCO7223572.1 prolyl oligopeptidase family serine peptidase [Pleionea sp. CnH1-48]
MKALLYFGLVLLSHAVLAAPLPIEDFAKQSQYNSIKLSPDGKHYAATAPLEDRSALLIIDRANMRVKHIYKLTATEHIDRFYWANNERIIFTRHFKRSRLSQGTTDGQIFAANINGTQKSVIFGYRAYDGGTTRGSKNRGPIQAAGTIRHILPDDPKHILVTARNFGGDLDTGISVFKLNIYSGKRTRITRTPFGNMRILFDSTGKPVIASGTNREGEKKRFLFEDNSWQLIPAESELNQFQPLSMHSDNQRIYLSRYKDGDTQELFEYDLTSKKLKKRFQDKTSDIYRLIREPVTQTIVGVQTMPGYIETQYLDTSSPFARLHKSLLKAFNGQNISITSNTADKKEWVIHASSDTNPGDFYLFNSETKKAMHLFKVRDWIKPSQMALMEPFSIKNRDDTTIYGYITLPNDLKKPVPMIVYVHGGPYGVQDEWGFDSTVQMLANNGYAVLQVNYRGSGGYGAHYEAQAYQKRSTMIQHDIIDATRWAQSLDQVHDSKVCIMGWSFGGYSALMAPLIEPDLFKCSIAAAGVYDAVKQEKNSDYGKIDSVSKKAARVYGEDENLLKKESPLTYIDKLKTPVFIVHGGKDERVTPRQAHLLKAALEKRNMPYEWMFKETEGHGFYNEDNRIEFYRRSLEFINKYIHQ